MALNEDASPGPPASQMVSGAFLGLLRDCGNVRMHHSVWEGIGDANLKVPEEGRDVVGIGRILGFCEKGGGKMDIAREGVDSGCRFADGTL